MPDSRKLKGTTELTAGTGWMLTFADLLSLLLTFFVLVFSMNTVQLDSWKAVVSAMSEEFNPERPRVSATRHEMPEALMPDRQRGLNLAYLEALLARSFSQLPLFAGGHVYRRADTVVISVPASAIFDHKAAVPRAEGVKALRALTGTLVQIRNKVKVAGHTDTTPVTGRQFRSNWELSLTRAGVVGGIMADAGYTQAMTVQGYADGRIDELDDRLTQQRRYELAERIDIVIIDERRSRDLYDLF
jgi:chemotaxis protein MotB